MTGKIASAWFREANSGTTPPYRMNRNLSGDDIGENVPALIHHCGGCLVAIDRFPECTYVLARISIP